MKGHQAKEIEYVKLIFRRVVNRVTFCFTHKRTQKNLLKLLWSALKLSLFILVVSQIDKILQFYRVYNLFEGQSIVESFETLESTSIFNSPLLKVRQDTTIDTTWVEDMTQERGIDMNEVQSIMGNVGPHDDTALQNYIYKTNASVMSKYCSAFEDKETEKMESKGLFKGTKLLGEWVSGGEPLMKYLTLLAPFKEYMSVKELSSPADCCFACVSVRYT